MVELQEGHIFLSVMAMIAFLACFTWNIYAIKRLTRENRWLLDTAWTCVAWCPHCGGRKDQWCSQCGPARRTLRSLS